MLVEANAGPSGYAGSIPATSTKCKKQFDIIRKPLLQGFFVLSGVNQAAENGLYCPSAKSMDAPGADFYGCIQTIY